MEETHNDVNALQQSLGVGYGDEEDVDWGTELSLLLSDDCMTAPPVHNSMPSNAKQEGVPLALVAADDVPAAAEGAAPEKQDASVKKEDAPVQVAE